MAHLTTTLHSFDLPRLSKAGLSLNEEKLTRNVMLSGLGLYRGSYMSAHVLLNLINELGKVIKCEACRAFYHFFRDEFNKFNNTRTRMLDSIYLMTLRLH